MIKKLIQSAEITRLLFELRLSNQAKLIKRALQDVCKHYEAGRILQDSADVRVLIHSHLYGENVEVRRWSLKALALIAHPEDTRRIIERVRSETDYKARSWGISGLAANPGGRTFRDLCREAGQENEKSFALSARLYAPSVWIKDHIQDVSISLNDDDVILEWSTFLIGYNKAPPNLFHPRYENEVFLGELNNHGSPEISEYSVWALCERPEFGFRNLKVPFNEFGDRPPNVRKWLYQLATKDTAISGLTADLILDFRRDTSVAALEGLAQGITDPRCGVQFDEPIIDWYSKTDEPNLKSLLLVGMAKRAHRNVVMGEIVEEEFKLSAPGSRKRRLLLAATEGNAFFAKLKAIESMQALAARGLQENSWFNVPIVNNGVIHMTKGNSFSAGGNVTAQNIVVGDMIASANQAVQGMSDANATDRQNLEKFLKLLAASDFDEARRGELARDVTEIAKAPTEENKKRLLATLQGYASTAATTATIGGGLAEMIEFVSKWFG